MNKLKRKNGITLIALIITIVVLLILAIVTINSVQDRSIIQHAQNATNEYSEGKAKENNQLGNYLAYLDNNVPVAKTPISKTESFVGCYADVEGDGTVDGIIYADLSEGVANKGNGTWGSNGTYTIPKTTNLNDYYVIKKEHQESGFGKKVVIAPMGATDKTKARFYVMSLSNFETTTPAYNTFVWYNNAYYSSQGMSDYATTTYTTFGKGYDNTDTMLDKVYGSGLKDKDIWKYIGDEFAKGWYIPSKDEWAAFGGELEITKDNYDKKHGLSDYYWSSSQAGIWNAWSITNTKDDRMFEIPCMNSRSVRLGTTF